MLQQGGIDQNMQQAILAAGSDPRRLQQQYEESVKKGSPDLAVLLGMQKIKSENEAAGNEQAMRPQFANGGPVRGYANGGPVSPQGPQGPQGIMAARIGNATQEMQMQMDNKPQTIIEQREAELMGQTQQETMASIGPGMQQAGNQSKQDAMRQQMMGNPQQGPNPAQSGIARMASGGLISGGGIASYANGGPTDISPEMKKAQEARIKDLLAKGIPPETIAANLKPGSHGMNFLNQLTGGAATVPKPAAQAQVQMPSIDALAQAPAPTPVTQAPAKEVAPAPAEIAGYKWGQDAPVTTPPQPPENQTIGPAQVRPAGNKWPTQQMPPARTAPPPQGIAAAANAPAEYLGKPITPEMQKTIDIAKGQKGLPPALREAVKGDWRGLNKQYADRNKPAPGVNPLAAEIAAGDLTMPNKPLPQPQAPMPKVDPASGGIASGLGLDPTTMEARDLLAGTMRGSPTDREAAVRGQFVKDEADYKGNIGEQSDLRARLEAELAAQNDPNKRKWERFAARAAGAGGRNSTTSAGGIAGSYNARNAQEAKRLEGIAALEGMLGKETASNKDYGSRLGTAGVGAYDKSAARTDTAAKGVADIGLKAQANQLHAQTNQLIAGNASVERLSTHGTTVTRNMFALEQHIADQLAGNQAYGQAQLKVANKNTSEEDKVKAQNKMADLEAAERAKVSVYMENYQSDLDAINRQIDKLQGVKGRSRSGSGGSFVPGSLKVN